jgi:ankyrin repeat protein
LGGEAVLERLLSAPHIDARTALPDGASALHICARYAPTPVVARLLAARLPVDTPDSRGQTPLMWAAASGRTETMALLLKAGAKINAATPAGFTPLLFAIKSGVPEASAALLDAGADATHRGPKNTSALQLALYQQNWAAAAQLVQRVPDNSPLWAEKDDQGLAPLNAAAMGGDLALVKLLLAKGAAVNGLSGPSSITWVTEANFGMPPPPVPPTPPLLLAAQHGQTQVMKLLLDHGADPHFTAANGSNIVISAAEGGRADALALAIAVGPDVNLADDRGSTALHVLAGSTYSPELAPMLALLRAHGARADLADKKGTRPRWWPMARSRRSKPPLTPFSPRQPPSNPHNWRLSRAADPLSRITCARWLSSSEAGTDKVRPEALISDNTESGMFVSASGTKISLPSASSAVTSSLVSSPTPRPPCSKALSSRSNWR